MYEILHIFAVYSCCDMFSFDIFLFPLNEHSAKPRNSADVCGKQETVIVSMMEINFVKTYIKLTSKLHQTNIVYIPQKYPEPRIRESQARLQ